MHSSKPAQKSVSSQLNEFEQERVPQHKLLGWRHFAGTYAGEHVAGTEFIIGAAFVAWGASTYDVMVGLLIGNLMAVLTWALITAPISVQSRLTLYEYLRRVAGPGFNKIYNLVSAVLFCALGGAMITVSASAVRILFDVPAQTLWYPTSLAFVGVALLVGIIVVAVAVLGFKKCAQFATVCSPWLLVMFVAGGMVSLPSLSVLGEGQGFSGFAQFWTLADKYIWTGTTPDGSASLTFWQIAAFAWVCNLAMHGSLGDMAILRFAKRQSYGYFSAFGMFFGHYIAWICAGIMGAGAMLALNTSMAALDAGGIAYAALGLSGILAVIIAGWTTSNPTIYRAGLAIQSLVPNKSRAYVTTLVGIATAIIACFPFVFTGLLNFVGYMGLLLAPVGAIIVSEHWLFARLGLTPLWSKYQGNSLNKAALISWIAGVAFAIVIEQSGLLHLFFLFIPTYLFSMLVYIVLAAKMGAKQAYAEQAVAYQIELAAQEAAHQKSAQTKQTTHAPSQGSLIGQQMLGLLALLSLASIMYFALQVWFAGEGYIMALAAFKTFCIYPSLLYFVSATAWISLKDKR
ncbi:purine-cytosine permease family protein [Paraglaciecola hydrolytica]|uniref:Nucleoside transporter n=1 Tax=Paraglaciecola hydrolytica TaxID=1799789 RepID=A0A148KMN8_9ALTE|nr:nucleoside transporter [Paraglaciecola hydrolytica]KXI27572.1 nucleoside transporter [Paraglaciecola hydrolytica]